ncbi:MAG: glycosyltransferase [Selenomonadaceae bacterium]|nr:glycosyltransferase [Selenomonadaceae bacterium]
MPKISYCCVFKDEEENIRKWAESALEIGDEVIAVDTGSSDKSCEILREMGIEPLYFKWKDDFSAAKNYALSKATGEWICFPDADEYFEKEDRKKVKSVINKLHKNRNIKLVTVVQHSIDIDDNNKLVSDMNQHRIFRNLPNLKYKERIHEYLRYTGNEPCQSYDTGIWLVHTGYSSHINKAKAARNLELLKQDVEKSGKITPLQASYMATSYTTLRDFENVAKYAKIALAGSDAELSEFLAKTYFLLARAQTETGEAYENIIKTVDEGLKRTKNYPDLVYIKFRLLMMIKNYPEAEKFGELFFERIQGDVLAEDQDHFFEGFIWDVNYKTAKIRFIKNEMDATAYDRIGSALAAAPDKTEVMGFFANCYRDKDPKETLAAFDKATENMREEDKNFLRAAFCNLPYDEKYLALVNPEENSYKYFLCKGDFFGAFKEIIKKLHVYYNIIVSFYNYYCDSTNMEFLREIVPRQFFNETKSDERIVDIKALIPVIKELQQECVSIFLGLNQHEYEEFKPFLKYLSVDNKNIVAAAFVGEAAIDRNAFKECALAMRYTASAKVLARFALIALGLHSDVIYSLLDELIDRREFDAAYNLLQRVTNNNDKYYMYLLKLAYYRKNFDEAREAFEHIMMKNDEARSFVAWCK